jgi:hypothetical protein
MDHDEEEESEVRSKLGRMTVEDADRGDVD